MTKSSIPPSPHHSFIFLFPYEFKILKIFISVVSSDHLHQSSNLDIHIPKFEYRTIVTYNGKISRSTFQPFDKTTLLARHSRPLRSFQFSKPIDRPINLCLVLIFYSNLRMPCTWTDNQNLGFHVSIPVDAEY